VAPQKFTTFTTFTTFAKFAKFANFNRTLKYPTLIPCHAPRLGSISEHAIPTPNPPSPVSDGRGVGG
jgi:hypothetical protein